MPGESGRELTGGRRSERERESEGVLRSRDTVTEFGKIARCRRSSSGA